MLFLKAGFPSSDHLKMVRATASNMFAMCGHCGEEVQVFRPEVVENINALLLGHYICPACRAALFANEAAESDLRDDDDMLDEKETEDDLDVHEEENDEPDEDFDDEHEAWCADEPADAEGNNAEEYGFHAIQEEAFYQAEMIRRILEIII